MQPAIPNYKSTNILVVGDIMLDRYWQGNTHRISPEAPVPVVNIHTLEDRPGGAGNVAVNIARLGCNIVLDGFAGDDEMGRVCVKALKAYGIQCGFELLPGVPTITKLRILSQHQQLIRLDFEYGINNEFQKALEQRFIDAVNDADVVVFSDYNKGSLRCIASLITHAKSQNKPIIIDPKGNDFEKYCGATCLTPNYSEFIAVVGACKDDEEIEKKAISLCEKLDISALLVTRSEFGMSLIQRDGVVLHIPTRAREVFDVTGAGDTVIAVLAASMGAGSNLTDAAILANFAAGIVVGKLGAGNVTVTELQNAIYRQEDYGRDIVEGILDEPTLLTVVSKAKNKGETIVFTNGCFDILHAGHVSYLKKARAKGDRLIVAVNSDASVKQLKGETRPLNTLKDRMIVLSELSCIDWVVEFGEQTPQRIISEILPDILVKGGDYEAGQVVGGKEVIDNGGRVEIVEFVDGLSTSRLIESIKNSAVD